MSIKLDPATAAKIEEFGRRRRRLILMRGICSFVTITLLSFGVVGLLDYIVFMEDWVRYLLSVVAYVILAVALYITCIRQLTHKNNLKELAIMFEMACPDMKEKLLSAVELSNHGNFDGYDSNIFKDAIQKDVANQVGKIQLESILPKKLILKWTRAAIGTFVVFAALLLIPNLKFGTLMLRAVVPTANVDRVSNIEVTLIEPGNSDTVVPEGDAISVVIEVSDPEINTAYMESVLENGEKDTVPMQKISDKRFSTVINVGRDDIKFRVRAHTALTRFYTLKAVPRPQVLEFAKTYNFPSYSGLKQKTETEKKGDIRILEGTEVELTVTADQPVKEAELRFENTGGKKWSVPLTGAGSTKLKGRFKVKSNATYKVHLVSEESGFINKFSPKYEVQSLADLLPSISLTLPKTDMSVPADELIDIRGNADDDLGLKEIFLSYKHNAGNWNKLNIINTNLKTIPISYKWELSSMKLEPGDELTFRLGARDKKGNEGYSSSIRLSIVASGFDQKRLNEFKEFVRVHKALSQLASAIGENGNSARKRVNVNSNEGKQKFVQLSSELDNSATLAEDVLKTIKRATALAGSKVSEGDMVLVGRVVSYVKNDMLNRASTELLSAVNSTDKSSYESARKLITKADQTSGKLASLFKVIVAGNGSDVITGDLYKILEEQKNLNSEAFQQNVSSEQVKRRQQSLFKNVDNTENLVNQVSNLSGSNFKGQYRNIKKKFEWLQKHNDDILRKKPHKTDGRFIAEFFADDNLRNKKHSYQTHKINEVWHHSPAPHVPNDYWSARWSGGFKTDKPGKHEFIIKHDGGVRLWVDEKLVVNDWIPGKERENKYAFQLDKDQTARIRLDYREDKDQAVIRFHCKYPDGKVHEVRPAKYDRYNFHGLKDNFEGAFREMVQVSRMSAEKSEKAREGIRKLLKEESEQIEKAAKDLKELAKAEEKLDKAIQEKKSEEEKKKLQKEVAEKAQKAEKSLENAIAQLEERAELEEMKKEADSQFVEDVSKTAMALENLKENSAMTEQAAEKAEKLAEALEDLEKGHELKEAQKDIEQMLANEENEDDPRKKITENPDLFKKAEETISELRDELKKEKDETSKQMAEDLNKALNEHQTNEVRNEMRHREHHDREQKDVENQLEKMLDKVAEAAKKHEEQMAQAREAINEESPTIGEQLDKLAQEARKNQQETAQALENIEEANAEDVQQQAKEMQKKQEQLNDKLEDMRKALRREANAQDISTEEGLEKAKDADNALAMLQQPPPKAEELLRKAANTEDKAKQQEALAETSEQQDRIAEALENLSKHYNNENEQELADSREDLNKAAEEMAGENKALEQEYEKAEALVDNEQKSIDEQIAELEKALAKDEVMQKELAQIAEQTAQDATQQLKETARKEEQIDQKLDQQANNQNAQQHEMKQQAQQQQQNQQQAQQAAEDLERSAKHQERLENNAQLDESNQLAEQAQQAAEKMAQAQQELQDGDNFQEAQQAVEQAKQAAQQAAAQAEAQQNAQAQQQQQNALQNAQEGEASPSAEASKQMAQALDKLDQAKAAQQAAQQAAQEAAAQAQQAQQAAQQAQQNSQAQQAAQQAQQAAAQAQQAAQQAQQANAQANAEQMMQQAQQAAAQAQQAMQQAMQQAQQAQNSQNQAQQAAAHAQMAQAQAQQAAAQAQQANAQAQQAMQQAQQSMQQAQQSQSQAMAQARQPSSLPGSEPGSGESQSQNKMAKVTPEKLKQEEDWAKLPKRLARDLKDAKQENVPDQYRKMVNAYFKIIAEQSKDQEADK